MPTQKSTMYKAIFGSVDYKLPTYKMRNYNAINYLIKKKKQK